MVDFQHKRGSRASLDALATANSLVPGQIYVIMDEERLAVGITTSTYQAMAKQNEAGGVNVTTTTVTAPTGPDNRGVYDMEVAIIDATVSPSNTIFVTLAPSQDTDENDPTLLDLIAWQAKAGTGNFTLYMTFGAPVSGPIKINYWKV